LRSWTRDQPIRATGAFTKTPSQWVRHARQADSPFEPGHAAASPGLALCFRVGWAPAYLAGRGFSAAIQQRWQAGYAPAGRDTLTRHLRALGYPAAVIAAAGLARRSQRGTLTGTFRDRAMWPIHDGDGTIARFIGRTPR
jgi:DNA primase catalytic core, N-terminal domain